MYAETHLTSKEAPAESDCIKVVIKRSSFFSLVNGKCFCRIKNRNILSAEKVILDERGKEKYHTSVILYENAPGDDTGVRKKYEIFDNESKIATAYTVKAINAEKRQSNLTIPRISELFIDFSNETFLINRLEDNSFVIKKGENTICTLSSFTLIKPQTMTIFDGQEVCLLAALYCLIRYMVHEEDLVVV